MKPELILQADILDIIFENRNKEYGAYKLRKEYNGRLKKAMIGVIILVAGIFIFNAWHDSSENKKYLSYITPVDPIVIAPPPVSELPPPAEPSKPRPTIRNPTFILTSDTKTDTISTITALTKEVQIGLQTQEGEAVVSDVPPPDHSVGTDLEKPAIDQLATRTEPLHHAEFMPEFPGGQPAFLRFLSKNLRVPDGALEPGQKIRIIVRFVVGIEGELSNMEFVQTRGEVFEQEVLRVLKKMPKWKPGSQNGEKVRVYFNLPIVFDAPEE